MELDQIRALLAVLEHGSFLKASRGTGTPRATLRLRVEALEGALGTPLVLRTHRGVEATEAGRRFADRARSLVRDADALAHSTRTEGSDAVGEFRLRAAPGFPPQVIGLFAAELNRRHPRLVQWSQVTHDPTRNLPGDIDIVVHFGPAAPPGPFRTFALRRFEQVALAAPEYLDQRGRPRSPDELADHALLSWISPGTDGRSWPLRGGGSLPVDPWFLSNDLLPVQALVGAGRGIALLPDDELSRSWLPGGPLEPVLPDRIGSPGAIWLLIPEATARTARGRRVIEVLREMGQGMSALDLEPDRSGASGR